MKKTKSRTRSKHFNQLTWGILIFGIFAFGVGIYQLLYLNPQLGKNLRYQQPVLVTGGVKAVLGFICLCTALYRFRRKNKIIRDIIELEELEEKEERRRWK